MKNQVMIGGSGQSRGDSRRSGHGNTCPQLSFGASSTTEDDSKGPHVIAGLSGILTFRHYWDRRSRMESAKVGKRGAIVVPAKLRRRFGIEEGTVVTAEEREDGILIRPAVVVPIEKYTPERKAEFLLSNATTRADYRKARKEVQKLGIDPDSIPHRRPA